MIHLIGRVEADKLLVDRRLLELFLATYEGKRILATFELYYGKKSPQQLGYFFAGLVSEGARILGLSEWEMKEWIKLRCAPVQSVNKATGETIVVGKSIASMEKLEFGRLIDSAYEFLKAYKVPVKTPEEYWESREGLDFNLRPL